MRQLPTPGEIYKHFKGNCYRIVTTAMHTEIGEKLVIYQALYGDYGIYARESSMFLAPVDKEKYPYITQKWRFELVESGAAAPIEPDANKNTESAVENKAESKMESKIENKTENKPLKTPEEKQSPEKNAEPGIDPMVLAYLDADTCKEKLQILTTMKDRLTNAMINTMAIAIDVEVREGDITERYEELKYCLVTKERFESRRLR